MSDFNMNAYREDMRFLVEKAQDEYEHWGTTIPGQQQKYVRTYIWIASLMLAAEFSFFINVLNGKYQFVSMWHSPHILFYCLAGAALLAASGCFLLGIDTLRGRGKQKLPFEDFIFYAKQAYNDAQIKTSIDMYTALLQGLNEVVSHRRTEVDNIAKKLRTMSWLLILSFCTAAFTTASLFIPN